MDKGKGASQDGPWPKDKGKGKGKKVKPLPEAKGTKATFMIKDFVSKSKAADPKDDPP